jgi:hypothetical protein
MQNKTLQNIMRALANEITQSKFDIVVPLASLLGTACQTVVKTVGSTVLVYVGKSK